MNENQKRTIHYSFKATPEEDEIIQKKMELTGIKNQSAFIRRIVLGGLIPLWSAAVFSLAWVVAPFLVLGIKKDR